MAEGAMSCDGGCAGVSMDCDGGGFDMGDMGDFTECDATFGMSNFHHSNLFPAYAAGDVVLIAGGLYRRPGAGNLQYVSDSSPNTCYLLLGVLLTVVILTFGGLYVIPFFLRLIFGERH